jgi:NAD(P)-dependent dehydrogenase (short-subunit alcohol dehydrogenase family)
MNLLEAHKSLAGKRAVVLGGAFGNGRAVTLALAESGVDVALCDNDLDALANIKPEAEAFGRRIVTFAADVCDPAALDAFYDKVEAEFGSVDYIVNLAGGVLRAPLLERSPEQDAKEIRLNYGYVIHSFRRGIPLIRKGGRGGCIINYTTIEAHRGAATYSVYAGAKAATTNFSRAMAVELAAEGIRVNILVPDATPSRTSYASLSQDAIDKLMALGEKARAGLAMYVPMGDPPEQEELAGAVLYLLSDGARRITGVTLHVDGGTMASSGFLKWPFGDGFMPAPMAGTLSRLLADGTFPGE